MSRADSEAASGGPLLAASLLVTPLRIEALIVRSGAPGVRVHVTGMGPQRARAAARALRSRPGDALVILGFCGALDPEAAPGDVIVADCLSSSPGAARRGAGISAPSGTSGQGLSSQGPGRVTCASSGTLATALEQGGLRVRRGPIVCVSSPTLGKRRAELRERSGAIAVDMESVWLAAGAGGRPCGVVRVVLDSPGHELLRPAAGRGFVRAAITLRRAAATLYDWVPEL